MEDLIAKIIKNRIEDITLPAMSEIDSKVSQSIAILSKRIDIEPYVKSGFVYSGNNGHHALAYYKIPENAQTPEESEPIFTVIGPDLNKCLEEAAKGLTETEEKHPKNWELYSMDESDLKKIKESMTHTLSTRQGILFSIHRTPLTVIDETYEPKTESTYRKKRLTVLKRNILKRYNSDF